MTKNDPERELLEHLPALRAYAVGLTRDRSMADDMVQETLEKAWVKLDSFEPGTNMRAWLFTILRNTYFSNIRKFRREVGDVDGRAAASLTTKPDHDGRLQLHEFQKEFNRLSDEQREALMLVGVLGMTYEEAAEACGSAVGTVKSRANRARKALIERLDLSDGNSLEITDPATRAVLQGGSGGFR